MSNPFVQATKEQAMLRMALVGPAGSGKTYSALNIAQHLVPGGKVAVIDTEHGSASKYAGQFDFDVIELTNFNPANYITMIQAAQQFGYDVLVIDSLSHAWNGTGGVLEIVDKAAQGAKGNSYVGWGKGTPAHNALIDAILAAKLHVIVTMRSKTDYVLEVGSNGKTTPRKVGTAPVQREGVDYEFDVVGEMSVDNVLVVTKTRCSALQQASFDKPGAKLADVLIEWLSDGEPAVIENDYDELPDDEPEYDEQPTAIEDTDHWWFDNKRRQQFWITNSQAGRNGEEVAQLWGINPSVANNHEEQEWFDVVQVFSNPGEALADLHQRSQA